MELSSKEEGPVIVGTGNGFDDTVVLAVAVHPFKSVTVTVYVAAISPVIVAVVPTVVVLLFHK